MVFLAFVYRDSTGSVFDKNIQQKRTLFSRNNNSSSVVSTYIFQLQQTSGLLYPLILRYMYYNLSYLKFHDSEIHKELLCLNTCSNPTLAIAKLKLEMLQYNFAIIHINDSDVITMVKITTHHKAISNLSAKYLRIIILAGFNFSGFGGEARALIYS